MSFDEFLEHGKDASPEQIRQTKSKYTDFICDNSDVVTIINILGQFTRGLNISSILTTGYKLEKAIEDRLADYCEKWSLNGKVFREAISFILQLLKLFEIALDESLFDSAISNLVCYSPPTMKQQGMIIDAITRFSYTNIARCVEVYKSENEKVKRLETLDYRQARFFKSTFVKKTGTFYIYQTIMEIEG